MSQSTAPKGSKSTVTRRPEREEGRGAARVNSVWDLPPVAVSHEWKLVANLTNSTIYQIPNYTINKFNINQDAFSTELVLTSSITVSSKQSSYMIGKTQKSISYRKHE